MDDLRSEIRAAFEKEQAAHPPASGLRDNILDAVETQPRRARSYQWLAVAAAVLLTIAVVGGLMATRLSRLTNGPAASSTRTTTPSAAPVADYGPPPSGVNLLYVHDPKHPTWLIGFDWTGQPRATVKLNAAQPNVGMAPDGQSFAIGLNAKGGNWQFLDGLGQPVATPLTLPGAYSTMWADDNQHVCSMTFDQQTLDYTLWIAPLGAPIKRVMVVAHDPNVGQTVVSLAACSFKNDRAIAVRTTNANPSEMWVVKLSDGTVLAHTTYTGAALGTVTASADAAFTAENSSLATGQAPPGAPATVIRRVSDETVVASLDPTIMVLGFSGDDSTVLVTRVPWLAGLTHLAVFDLAGHQVWSDDGTQTYFGIFETAPGGRDFAVAYAPPPAQNVQPTTIVILHGDGTVNQLPGLYAPAW
ncbi:MAG: hypothetical protein ABI334_07680 [Candidatus Dormiibacterota bacterium]